MKHPSYLNLSKNEWEEKVQKAKKLMEECRICPRSCGSARVADKKTGFCRMGKNPVIFSSHPHFGEENCLVGISGSGTIFFTSCNLACVYCQNFDISQERRGEEITIQKLSAFMIRLERIGCHNINLVTPSIWIPQIINAVFLARIRGLSLPLVYNSGGYDSVSALKLLKGIIDIYMPDIKYADDKIGAKYSLVSDYWTQVRKAVKEMYQQVGDLVIDKRGLAKKGLLIRHLVLPNNIAGTEKAMEFLGKEISPETYVNIMTQYYPCHRAFQYPEINRRISDKELEEAYKFAQKYGLHRFDKEVI